MSDDCVTLRSILYCFPHTASSPTDILQVDDDRPLAARNLDLTDLSTVEKYTMPAEKYSALPDSVMAYKKRHKLGRFDPDAPEIERQKVDAYWSDANTRGIEKEKRCELGTDSSRRGTVKFVGEVPEIPGIGGPWIGIELDEPVGKNQGSVGGKQYFQCGEKRGLFVRPERVEIGDYRVLVDDELDNNMEEM